MQMTQHDQPPDPAPTQADPLTPGTKAHQEARQADLDQAADDMARAIVTAILGPSWLRPQAVTSAVTPPIHHQPRPLEPRAWAYDDPRCRCSETDGDARDCPRHRDQP